MSNLGKSFNVIVPSGLSLFEYLGEDILTEKLPVGISKVKKIGKGRILSWNKGDPSFLQGFAGIYREEGFLINADLDTEFTGFFVDHQKDITFDGQIAAYYGENIGISGHEGFSFINSLKTIYNSQILTWRKGDPDFFQGFTTFDKGKHYAISSSNNFVFYRKTDCSPEAWFRSFYNNSWGHTGNFFTSETGGYPTGNIPQGTMYGIASGATLETLPSEIKVCINNGNILLNSGYIVYNLGEITFNANQGSVSNNLNKIINNEGLVKLNDIPGIIMANNSLVEKNLGKIVKNSGTLMYNSGVVTGNYGIIRINLENVKDNYGIIYDNSGIVQNNRLDFSSNAFGQVIKNHSTGVVNNNFSIINSNLNPQGIQSNSGFVGGGQLLTGSSGISGLRLNWFRGSGDWSNVDNWYVNSKSVEKLGFAPNNGFVSRESFLNDVPNYASIYENYGIIDNNNGTIKLNRNLIRVNQGKVENNVLNASVIDNNGDVLQNYGLVSGVSASGSVFSNYDKIINNSGIVATNRFGGLIENNGQKVKVNSGTINNNLLNSQILISFGETLVNSGFIGENHGHIEENFGKVDLHIGSLKINQASGVVECQELGSIIQTNLGKVKSDCQPSSLDYSAFTWKQVGSLVFDDQNKNRSIVVDKTAQIFAVGYITPDDKGLARVFYYNQEEDSIQKMGLDISVDSDSGGSGPSLSLAAAGQLLAVGSISQQGANVKVYRYNYNSLRWIQEGQDINIDYAAGSLSAISVSLNQAGDFLIIGIIKTNNSCVRSFSFKKSWIEAGEEKCSQ
jgi:hypothetical protein